MLATEAAGLRALAAGWARIRPRRGSACRATGRVVVSGMGKSGHVGAQDRRHPRLDRHARAVRASGRGLARRSRHDRGRATRCWRCPIPAKPPSWPTWSPMPAASACRWWRSPARGQFALARAADVALLLPPAPEACPMGLAPTTMHDHADGARRCAGGGAADPARLHRGGFPPVPSRRPARRAAAAGARPDARPASAAAGRRRHADGPRAAADDRASGSAASAWSMRRRRLVGIVTDGDLRRAHGARPAGAPVGDDHDRARRARSARMRWRPRRCMR